MLGGVAEPRRHAAQVVAVRGAEVDPPGEEEGEEEEEEETS